MALVKIYAVLSNFDFVAKFTINNLNNDFTNRGRGRASPPPPFPPSSKPCTVDLYLSDWIWRKVEPECGQIWANCDHFIHGNPCLLHSKLCYQHKYFVTHVTNKSAKLESTAVRQLGWFHTWREVKQPPAWQQPQPGTIISFLAMHTAQITHKYLKKISHKYCICL